MKQLNQNDANAIKIVVADRMGFKVGLVDLAKSHLTSGTVGREDLKAIGEEADKIQKAMHCKGALLLTANAHAVDVMREHDLSYLAPPASTPSVALPVTVVPAPVPRRHAHH